MTRSLQREWPDLVRISRRYGRYTHSVDWARFANDPPLRLREGVNLAAFPEIDEYDLRLRAIRYPKSGLVRKLWREYDDCLATLRAPDELWRGMPAFRPILPPPKLTLSFATEQERDELVARLNVTVDKKYRDKAWAARYPDSGRHDPASLRFEP